MKKLASIFLAAFGVFGLTAFTAPDADAQHRHHHHGARVGVYIGAPWVVAPWPYYHRPYYYDPYYSRPIVIREQPTVYIEQSQAPVAVAPPPPAPAPQAQQQYWYFCQDTQTYYPHVQTCATPWQRVMPHATR
jgi:hypothetical protein